jgi:single-stranded DNA-binding protein
MPHLNQCNFIGHVGRDAELKTSRDQSKQWCEFNLAVQLGNSTVDKAAWVKCSIWGKHIEKAALLIKKGDAIFVTGRITKLNAYVNKNNDPAVDFQMSVSEWQLLTKKDRAETDAFYNQNPALASTVPPGSLTDDLGDIPF